MRLSNNQIFKTNLDSILSNQREVNKATQQVATQKRVLTASDDPAATAQAMLYGDRIQTNEQFTKNITMLNNRLNTQESVLDNIKSSIDSAYSKAVQAGNGALAAEDRDSVADELESIKENIFSLMNSQTEDGKYIFSGYQDSKQTYVYNATSKEYEYQGDQGQHKIKVAEGVEIRSSDNGFDVFESVDKRLNISNVAPAGTTAFIKEQAVFDQFHKTNYNADPAAPAGSNTFDIVMTAGTPNSYQLQQGATVISTGTFEGNLVKVAGLEVNVTAVPGTVNFDLAKPEKENVLNTLDEMITALRDPSLSDDVYRQHLADGMVGLDNAKNSVSQAQAGLGGRLNTAKLITQSNADLDINNKSAKADLIELDMAEAITELTKHETALQASQATFGRLSNLSLLDFIR